MLCIVLVAGLWLAVAETLPSSKVSCPGGDTNVNIQFGYAFYILLVGGLFSLGAASFNLLCARSAADRRRSLRLRFRYICYSSITVTNHPAKCSMTHIPQAQVLFLEFFLTHAVFLITTESNSCGIDSRPSQRERAVDQRPEERRRHWRQEVTEDDEG